MSTSTRMLSLLSLLQTHRHWPGEELATRLEVSPRTLRRDVERLRDLGYAVDASRGVAGGYQLRPGGQLPPLLLEDEEAVAIAVGLRTAASGADAETGSVAGRGLAETSLQALTKVIGVMPAGLRRRMEAVSEQTDTARPWSGAPVVDAGVLTVLAQACRDHEPVHLGYTAKGADPTQRWVEPHRLVTLGRRWYLVAYDRDRQDWRSFRLDRVTDPRPSGQRFRPRELPADGAVSFVLAGMRSMPQRHAVRVRVEAPVADVVVVAGEWAEVTALPCPADGCLLEMNVDTLDWAVLLLARLPADFTVEAPDELRAEVARLGAAFARASA